MLPKSSVLLDGSNSSALGSEAGGDASGGGGGNDGDVNDGKVGTIVSFHWSFVSLNGKALTTSKTKAKTYSAELRNLKSEVKILSPNKQKTSVEGLKKPGKYVFELVIADDKKHTAKDTVTINVI